MAYWTILEGCKCLVLSYSLFHSTKFVVLLFQRLFQSIYSSTPWCTPGCSCSASSTHCGRHSFCGTQSSSPFRTTTGVSFPMFTYNSSYKCTIYFFRAFDKAWTFLDLDPITRELSLYLLVRLWLHQLLQSLLQLQWLIHTSVKALDPSVMG